MISKKQILYCCGCLRAVYPRLTNGEEIYPHRQDLRSIPFWKCDECGNYVGCHHKTKQKTKPLGCIPTKEIRDYRKDIHNYIDWYWKEGHFSRKEVYEEMSRLIGHKFHSADISSEEEAIIAASAASQIFEGHEKFDL